MKRQHPYSKFSFRPSLGVIALLVWSVIMLVIGSMAASGITRGAEHIFGLSKSYASRIAPMRV